MTEKPRTPTDFTICRDCFQAWPTENLQDGNDKPCDCGDGAGTYFFELVELEPVLDLLERLDNERPKAGPIYLEIQTLLREHGRLK